MANVKYISRCLLNRIQGNGNRNLVLRYISTGKYVKANTSNDQSKPYIESPPDFSKPLENKNWVSFGYDYEDEKLDKVKMHGFQFFCITILLVVGGFFIAYWPDFEHRDWAKREAFIRLHERELLGLDPIDKNYVDPSKMVLPSDEELGDAEIII